MVEQWPFKPLVVGSTPTGPTNKITDHVSVILLTEDDGSRVPCQNFGPRRVLTTPTGPTKEKTPISWCFFFG